ncbi:serine/threonine protein kinase-like [Tropilaelaps mercedesae]|uniref:Serine/threonine protein kinase-like n=1 Tax=Tropilaelaps mercedesae TaxID=418985 RepID=A0A1V9XN55_9ACAR|nr:serine/threonine protein kinase-like [Tropilaelaps mercedesae]
MPRSRCMYGDRIDLYKHPFIVGVDWKKLSSSEKLFPQPDGYCKILQKNVPPRFRRNDLTDSEQAALSPKVGIDDLKFNRLLNPTELEDAPYVQQSTFISTMFRKTLELCRTPKKLGKGPLMTVMGYNAASPALSIPDTYDLDRYNAERLVITIPKRSMLELGIHIDSAIGEDESRYFYVKRFSDSFFYDSLPLIEGDVLLAMNGKSLINESMAAVKAKLALHQKDMTSFVVQASSSFRLASAFPDFGSLLRSLPRISVKVPPAHLLDFGSLVRTTVVGYTDGWVINGAHFVWKTTGKQSLYVGDIIQSIDGVEAITLTTEEIDARLQRGVRQVEVIPVSSLRTRRVTVDRIFRAYGGSRDTIEGTTWIKVQKKLANLTPKETVGLGPVHLRYVQRRIDLANRESEPLEATREPHRSLDYGSL